MKKPPPRRRRRQPPPPPRRGPRPAGAPDITAPTPVASGDLRSAPLSELLFRSFQEAQNGSLVIQSPCGRQGALSLVGGRISRVFLDGSEGLLRRLLRSQLPGPMLSLVSGCGSAERDGIETAQELGFLTQAESAQLRSVLYRQLVVAIGELAPRSLFASFDDDYLAGQPELDAPLDPVLVHFELLRAGGLSAGQLLQLSALREQRLALQDGVLQERSLDGSALSEVQRRLLQRAASVAELQRHAGLPRQELSAALSALVSFGRVRATANAQSALPPPLDWAEEASSRNYAWDCPRSVVNGGSDTVSVAPPRESATVSVAPPRSAATGSTPPTSSSRPPRRSSVPRSSVLRRTSYFTLKPSGASPEERSIESGALEAWMRVVDDPGAALSAVLVTAEAVGLFPYNPRLRFYHGCVLSLGAEPRLAVAELKRALALDPKYYEAADELERLSGTERRQPARSLFERLRAQAS